MVPLISERSQLVSNMFQWILSIIFYLDWMLLIPLILLLDGFLFERHDPEKYYTVETLTPEKCYFSLYYLITFIWAHNFFFGVVVLMLEAGHFLAWFLIDWDNSGPISIAIMCVYFGALPIFLVMVPFLFWMDPYIIRCTGHLFYLMAIERAIVWLLIVGYFIQQKFKVLCPVDPAAGKEKDGKAAAEAKA